VALKILFRKERPLASKGVNSGKSVFEGDLPFLLSTPPSALVKAQFEVPAKMCVCPVSSPLAFATRSVTVRQQADITLPILLKEYFEVVILDRVRLFVE
jgi:hypothetical protein